jgi:hypothetical protein
MDIHEKAKAVLEAASGRNPDYGQISGLACDLADALLNGPDIFIALNDVPGQASWVGGAFSTEAKAREACQEDNEAPLAWDAGTATAKADGEGTYTVLMCDLDVAI